MFLNFGTLKSDKQENVESYQKGGIGLENRIEVNYVIKEPYDH